MYQRNKSGMGFVALLVAGIALTGCSHMASATTYKDGNAGIGEEGYFYNQYSKETKTTTSQPVAKSVKADKAPCATAPVNTGYTKTSVAYPTGRAASSAINVEKIVPATVRLGSAYDYTIKVTNLTDLTLANVKLSEVVLESFDILKTSPAYSTRDAKSLAWDLGSLSAGETKTIVISGAAKNKNDIPCCTSVDYDVPALCTTTAVIQPAIALAVDAPASSIVCDRIPVKYTVKNTGDTTLTGVVIDPKASSGVRVDQSSLNVGSLAAGEVKTLTATAQADSLGVKTFSGMAKADEDVSADSGTKSTTVVKPAFAVTAKASREQVYAGRDVTFNFTVKNTGTAAAENAVAEVVTSANASVNSASAGGVVSGKTVRWNLGSLAVNATKEISVKVTALDAGDVAAQVMASGICCDAQSAKAAAVAKGIPALLLEVVDLADPIEVGAEQTYQIVVTNQGTADATGINVVATLEEMDYVSSSGVTSGQASGADVVLGTVARLGAKNKASWNVKVRTKKAGDMRFHVKMNSDQLGRPVNETESTYVY